MKTPTLRAFALVCAMFAFISPSRAHNLDTTATSISFASDFMTTMSQRAAMNQSLVQANDEFWVLLKTTPGPGTTTGVGGYQTFYVPNGIQVIEAAYVFPDATDPRGFRNIPMKGQSPMAIGNGSVGSASSPELIGFDLPGVNGLGYDTNPVNASGLHRGTLAGVYADTGIFYATDPRLGFNSYGVPVPPLTGAPLPMSNNSGDTVGEYFAANIPNSTTRKVLGVMTLWDSYQLRAYGRSDVSPLLDSNGRGNAPWGLANVVAGPQSGYAWEFDAAAYDSTSGTHAQKLQAAIKIGPWNRVRYPGSQISQDQPGLVSTVLGHAGIDASLMGIDPTAIPADTKAVRMAIGQLELGRPEYSAVKVRVLTAPGNGDCNIMNADAFGGDAGGTDGGKDHIWRYFDPTVVSLNPCTFLQKVASKSLVAPGETFYYDITFANNGTVTLPDFKLTDVLPSGLTHLSATPAQTTISGQTLTWNFGTVEPGDFITIRHYVKATGTGTLFNTVTAMSGINLVGTAQSSVEIGVRAILDKSKTVTPSAVAPGQTVAYALNIENIGTGNNGVPLRVREFLPAGFTYASLQGATLNGATIASPTITIDSANPSQPLFTISQGIQPGKKLVITFNALVGASVQPGTYWNAFQLEYEGKIVPPIPEAPVTVAGGKIGDTVYRDWDGGGTQDAGETGISGVTVQLYAADGTTLLATTTTDSTGKYFFPGLVAGTYVVKVTPPASTTLTGDPDTTLDSQHTVVLSTDQQYLTADFGYRPSGSGSIGDIVFEDVGNDGAFTSGTDTGIAGVGVQLYADTNGDGIVTPGVDVLIGATTTNGSGLYSFTGLAEGFNYLAVVNPADGALATHFGVDPYQASTANPQVVTNLTGSYLAADFGFWRVAPGSIGDQVFIDANGNGVYDPGTDSPLGGVTVTLLRDGSPIATTTTAPDGTYLFDNLGPGAYTVSVSGSDPGIPAGYASSTSSYQVSLSAGQDFLTADFPFTPLISKSVDKAYATTGEALNFGVNVNYNGGNLLSDVTVRDYLPLGTTFTSAGQGGVLQTFSSAPGTPGTDAGSAGNGSVTLDSVSGIEDTWLEENSVNRNYGGAVDLRIDPESGRPERALVRFTLPNNLPNDAVITSAVLKLTKISGNTIDITAHQADSDWTEGTLNGNNGVASWNDRMTATAWDTPGGDYIQDPNDPVVSSGAATGDRTWQVSHIVQNWIDGAPNHGFLLKHPLENTGNNQNVFASSENGTAASRPTLVITYTSTARPGTSNTLAVSPTVGAVGSPFTVTMTVQATENVSNVVPSAPQVFGGSATVSGPTPASRNLTANTAATFTWTVTPSTNGEFSFSASASNGTVNFLTATSNSALASPNGENQYVVWDLGSNIPGSTGVTAQNKYLYAFGGADTLNHWAYNTANGAWNNPLNPADTPAGFTVNSGGALANDGTRYIYALRGDTTRAFASYDALNNTWDDAGIADLPGTTDKAVLKGGSLVYLNGFVYATLGNDSLQFWRYSVAGNSWTQMANALGTVNNGAGLTTDGTNIYATQGDGKKGFWRYNVGAGTWTALTPFADNFGDGGGLVYANGAIYVLRGGGQKTFRRFNIGAGAGGLGTWTTLTPTTVNVDDGAAIAFDGTSIYVLCGKSTAFHRYNIGLGTGGLGTWTTLATAPATVGWGGALSFLSTGNVSYTNSTAMPTLVVGGSKQVVVRMTVTAESAINNITAATAPTFTAPAGTTVTFSQSAGNLISADDDISGTGDPVIYEWLATVTPGSTPGEVTFTTTSSTGGSAPTNSVLVAPTLTYIATVASSPPTVIENTAFVQDFSGTISLTPSNTTQTATSATIGDYVWVDTDADGVQDAGEYGLAGITVRLYAADGITLLQTAITDANGAYRFFGVAPGTYSVNYDASSVPGGYFGSTLASVSVSLASSQQFDNADFGLAPIPAGTGSIGDYVWIDANNDGVQDSGELPLADVTVNLERLINGNWSAVATATTGSDGLYNFTGLSAAQYRVTVDTASQISSPYAQGAFDLGNVMAPTHDRDGIDTPHVALVTLATNSTVVTNADFGYNWSGSIGDKVWWDYDTDGLQDEIPLVGIDNARVQLYFDQDFDGVFDRILGDYEILRVFTDSNGDYLIPNLPPGNYFVDVYEDSITTSGTRDIVPTTDDIVPVNLVPASMDVLTADFGYFNGARVEATMFWDVNHNSIREVGEDLLAGVTVTLTGNDNLGNPVTRTAVSDANGNVVFLVPEGNYTISYPPSGVTTLYPALGTPTTPLSYAFEAVAGEDGIKRFDFGVDNTGAIGDTIYADTDGNGSQGAGEPGLAGVTVNLYFDANGDGTIDYGAGDQLLETAVTDSTGNYSFIGLADTTGAQRYVVEAVTGTLPSGYQTVPTGFPVGANTATSRYATALTGGQVISIVDFGYPLVPATYRSISGTIYNDNGAGSGTASDGNMSGTEPGLPSVTVTVEVDTDANGSFDQTFTIPTDANGFYSLGGILQGADVRVTVNEATLPSTAFVQTGDPNGAPLSNVFNITNLQVDTNNLDFGYVENLGSITGTVVVGNGNGTADSGEPGVDSVPVILTYAGVDGILGTSDDVVFNTTTDSNGDYSFTGLRPGPYQVTTTVPSGHKSIADADGGNTNNISVSLALGANITDRDFEYKLQKCPDLWTEWQDKWDTVLGGDTAFTDNPEGDRYSNLLEYAFCMPPHSGGRKPFCLTASLSVAGAVDGVFSRTSGGPLDITYVLDYAADLGNPTSWSSITLTSGNTTVTDNGDGSETVRIVDLESLTGLTAGAGFVRIRVLLDNGVDTAEDSTEALGWVETQLGLCCRTYNNPFLACATFTGTVDSVSGQDLVLTTSAGPTNIANLMLPGVSYYIEVETGDLEGHRFDVTGATATSLTLADDSSLGSALPPFNTLTGAAPSLLAGDRIALHTRRTINGLFPAASLGAGATQETSDEVQVYAGGTWAVYWLYDDGGSPRWVNADDVTMADAGATVIPAGQGVFFHNRTAPAPILAYGEVRGHDFRRPLLQGVNMVGGGYPVDQSATGANSRQLNLADGFFGSRNFKTADSFFIWRTDAAPASTGYESYFLLDGGTTQPAVKRWVQTGDVNLVPRDAELLFRRDSGVMTRVASDKTGYLIPSPWTP
jgi:uncharacterized repeat protein (TIGR01451 family)